MFNLKCIYYIHLVTGFAKIGTYGTYKKFNNFLILGNSDRRAAAPVKEHAKGIKKRSPAMRAWKENGQRTCVNSMADGDFFSAEQSHIMPKAGTVKITLHQVNKYTI